MRRYSPRAGRRWSAGSNTPPARPAGAGPKRESRARPDPAPHESYLWDTGFHWGEWLEPGFEITDFGAFVAADKSHVATAYLHRSAAVMAEVAGCSACTGDHRPLSTAGRRDARRLAA